MPEENTPITPSCVITVVGAVISTINHINIACNESLKKSPQAISRAGIICITSESTIQTKITIGDALVAMSTCCRGWYLGSLINPENFSFYLITLSSTCTYTCTIKHTPASQLKESNYVY